MKPYSVTRRLIAAVLVLELAAAIALTWLAVGFERHTRLRSFDVGLRAQAASLFGAVGDADDPQDNVVLDVRGLTIPRADFFDVEGVEGKVLGRSAWWPGEAVQRQIATQSTDQNRDQANGRVRDGVYRLRLRADSADHEPRGDAHSGDYRFVVLHAVRVVDPGDKDGGVKRPVSIIYGASTAHMWSEVGEAVRFYSLASLVLLSVTGLVMSWFLRKSLAPLAALAEEAGRISAQQWRFQPQERARAMVELAPLTRALELALKRLERSFAQQRRFISDAAHELKTDLAIGKSSLQLLAMRRRSVEEYERGLEVCLADTLRIERTVMEMLTLARVEQAERGREPSDGADLRAWLLESVERFASYAELRQVAVTIEAPEPAPVALSEKDCRLLCTNLLLNALQHSDAEAKVSAVVQKLDGWVTLSIRDEGVGISPESLPHVFEPFYRGDASRDRRTGGTGLGLAICKGVCEQAGGKITIESELGVGTEAVAQLPAWTAEKPRENSFSAS